MARKIRRRANYAPRPEWRRDSYGMRYYEKGDDGEPVRRLQMLSDDQGNPVTSLALAEAIVARTAKVMAPIEPKRAPAPGVVRLTIGQVVLKWRDAHPDNASRHEYAKTIGKMLGVAGDEKRATLGADFPDQLTMEKVDAYRKAKVTGHVVPLAYLRSVLRWAARKRLIPHVDADVLQALARGASKHDGKRVLSQTQFEDIYEVFRRRGPHYEALCHCLSTYGWRPITACRLNVGDIDLVNEQIRHRPGSVKGRKDQHVHMMLPETVKLLRPIIEGRDPNEPVFLHDSLDGSGPGRWKTRESAVQLNNWYNSNCKRYAPLCGGIYALKRWALETMELGHWPWPQAVKVENRMDFTGHKTLAMVLRYRRNSPAAQRQAVGVKPPAAQERPATKAFLAEMVVVTDDEGSAETYDENSGGASLKTRWSTGGASVQQSAPESIATMAFTTKIAW